MMVSENATLEMIPADATTAYAIVVGNGTNLLAVVFVVLVVLVVESVVQISDVLTKPVGHEVKHVVALKLTNPEEQFRTHDEPSCR